MKEKKKYFIGFYNNVFVAKMEIDIDELFCFKLSRQFKMLSCYITSFVHHSLAYFIFLRFIMKTHMCVIALHYRFMVIFVTVWSTEYNTIAEYNNSNLPIPKILFPIVHSSIHWMNDDSKHQMSKEAVITN